MLAPVPLHEPTAVLDVLAALGAAQTFPSAGLAVLHDVHADPTPGVVLVPDVPADPPQHDRVRALGPLFGSLARARGATSAVLVVLRDGSAAPRGSDYAWLDAYRGAATRAGITPAGVYVLAGGVLTRVREGQPAVA